MTILLAAFEADVIATAAGFWRGGRISGQVFFLLFAATMFVVLRMLTNGTRKTPLLVLTVAR